MRHCAICYHLYELKNAKATHGGVMLLVKFHVSPASWIKVSFLHGFSSTFFKLYKWYQIAQSITKCIHWHLFSFLTQKRRIIILQLNNCDKIRCIYYIWDFMSSFKKDNFTVSFFCEFLIRTRSWWNGTDIEQRL